MKKAKVNTKLTHIIAQNLQRKICTQKFYTGTLNNIKEIRKLLGFFFQPGSEFEGF